MRFQRRLHHFSVCLLATTFCVWLSNMPGTWAETLQGHVYHQQELIPPQKQAPGIVGLNLSINHQRSPVIMEIYPGTPAAKAGLQVGDQIIAVNNQATQGLSVSQVDKAISDIPGDVVHFLVSRYGKVIPIDLTVESMDKIASPKIRLLYESLFGKS